MLGLDLKKINHHLDSQGIKAELQKESNQLCILLKIGEREYPLFIRIYEGQELLQLLAFLPCNIKQTAYADIARLLHLLNKEIDIPGFGMDEESDVVFYRCMIPSLNKQIEEKVFNSYLSAVQVICQSFAAVVAAVAYGAVTFEDVVKQSKENHHQSLSQSYLKKD